MKLKSSVGKIEVKGLGITLTQKSTSEEIERALKVQPNIEKFIIKTKEDGKASK